MPVGVDAAIDANSVQSSDAAERTTVYREHQMAKIVTADVVSVHAGSNEGLSEEAHETILVELDGVAGDRHRSWVRETWMGDKQPKGTARRNERQWSAVSVEELAEISESMDLDTLLTASELEAILCLQGVAQLSRLPKGTLLRFPSGAELVVEEYNHPVTTCRAA